MAVQKKNITVDEFEQFIHLPGNDNRRFELIDGKIIEKVPTEEHGLIAALLCPFLMTCVRTHNLGRVTVEPRHGLPDVAFTRKERLLPVVKEDLAIEIKSPKDRLPKMRRKAAYYLENGSQMVWLVFTNLQQIEVHTSEASVRVLGIDDTLVVKDIFAEDANR